MLSDHWVSYVPMPLFHLTNPFCLFILSLFFAFVVRRMGRPGWVGGGLGRFVRALVVARRRRGGGTRGEVASRQCVVAVHKCWGPIEGGK